MSQDSGKVDHVEKRQKPRAYLATPQSSEISSVGFAHAARQLSESARALGLRPPAFRSPPRTRGLHRSITRRPDGSATVAVALRGRPAAAVMADMIDGILVANHTSAPTAPAVRDQLWAAGQRNLAQALTEGDSGEAASKAPRRSTGGVARRPVLRAVTSPSEAERLVKHRAA